MSEPTTYNSPPADVEDPFANKAIAAGLTTIGGMVTQLITTGSFEVSQEGATAIIGGVATFLVWYVSNKKRRGI